MMMKIKKTVGVLLLAILLVFSTSPALMAQPASDPAPGDTSPEVQEPVDDYDMRPEIGRIDQGNKVGEKIALLEKEYALSSGAQG